MNRRNCLLCSVSQTLSLSLPSALSKQSHQMKEETTPTPKYKKEKKSIVPGRGDGNGLRHKTAPDNKTNRNKTEPSANLRTKTDEHRFE